eukprot:264856-Rhodomonas_salina.1
MINPSNSPGTRVPGYKYRYYNRTRVYPGVPGILLSSPSRIREGIRLCSCTLYVLHLGRFRANKPGSPEYEYEYPGNSISNQCQALAVRGRPRRWGTRVPGYPGKTPPSGTREGIPTP